MDSYTASAKGAKINIQLIILCSQYIHIFNVHVIYFIMKKKKKMRKPQMACYIYQTHVNIMANTKILNIITELY